MTTYSLNCPKCKKKTHHSVKLINRRRGYKLYCTLCLNERPSYINFKRLKEFEEKEEVESEV